MCLLTFMPESTNISFEKALVASKANPNGFGFAIKTKTDIIKDHDMDFAKLWDRWAKIRAKEHGPALFHFRVTTHGETNTKNCHPFDIGNDTKSVIAHNGILPIRMPVYEERSDTKIFAELILPSMGGIEALDNKKTWERIENWATGSKLVVLSSNPYSKYDWYIINEHLGHWHEDMWWSNKSYINYLPITNRTNYGYSYGMYSNWYPENKDYKTQDEEMNDTEIQEYIEEELYEDEFFDKIIVFTEYTSKYIAKVTCYNCASEFYVDSIEVSATHCGNCRHCLYCSQGPGLRNCSCWNDYEYGESYIIHEKPQTQGILDI